MNRDARDLLWQTENHLDDEDERSGESIRGGKMIKESKRRKNSQITRNKDQAMVWTEEWRAKIGQCKHWLLADRRSIKVTRQA
ncbi:hypothetical protein FOQG_16518 [Fusarium oxysporum f. sp. raphani 54005]|uniref:Uncharacterized protein n=1 Tax=Fusarium oxysporum f. sp. raphani 54005 TaxID=1089458 RepID=X0BK32_FUSOX|nr:hypothetical protein FOQG_16518 [Fusarium oxysporum f. sp. raphani 54005]